MTVKITIIGLGKIGTSAGLALAKHTNQLYRLGHDLHPENARRAQKLGAIDKVMYNLPASVEEADIVLLALPIDQIRETMEIIAQDLKEGAVVMDSAPAKQAAAAWAQEFFKPGRYYVGLAPAINAQYLYETQAGADGAREDLFQNGVMGIVAPRGTASAAIKLATDLVTLLGAKPLFMDMIEADSLLAMVHLLPQLISNSLAQITINQPGWLEGRKLAGAVFAQASSPLATGDSPEALAQASQFSQEHITRLLDLLIDQLMQLRQATQEAPTPENSLAQKMNAVREGHNQWKQQRAQGEWQEEMPQAEMPTASGEVRRWFIGKRGSGN
ncbi:MAG: prephenate dehydrogenase [Anaerolineales bacterium]|nr:prephenate dehydrogenase [Anaerolineales bacterium]